MGWDIRFAIALDQPRGVLSGFCNAFNLFSLYENHSVGGIDIFSRYTIYKSDQIAHIEPENISIPIDAKFLLKSIENREAENLCFSFKFRVSDRYTIDKDENLRREDFFGCLRFMGQNGDWPAQPFPMDAIYYEESSKRYNPQFNPRSSTINIKKIANSMAEIAALLKTETILGLPEDQEHLPDLRYLVFHRKAQDFLEDLQSIALFLEDSQRYEAYCNCSIDMIEVELAALDCDRYGIRFLETEQGPIIYHKNMTGGSLGAFYKALSNRLLR